MKPNGYFRLVKASFSLSFFASNVITIKTRQVRMTGEVVGERQKN